MDTYHLRIFQRHVLDQCRYLLFAARDMNEALKQQNSERVFYSLQNLLNAGANISKMLWGQRGDKAEQRKRLRESIGISDTSPLREVKMRNNFEHMDERIDRWWEKSERHNHFATLIGPRSMLVGADPIDTFRWFDPSTADVIFWGEPFNLQALVTEVERIFPPLEEEAAKPHWDQPCP